MEVLGMEAYSMDLRKRVLAACDAGEKTKPVANKFSVSSAWVRRLKQRRREDGSIAPRSIKRVGKPKLDDAARARVLEWVNLKPDSTLEELRRRIGQELDIRISIGALWETLRRMKLSFKKSRSTRPSSRVRTWSRSVPTGTIN
jgi:transposase